MKKIIFPLLFLAMTNCFAQLGARVGVDINTINFSREDNPANIGSLTGGSKTYVGYVAGIFYEFEISERFSVRPEVNYTFYRNLELDFTLGLDDFVPYSATDYYAPSGQYQLVLPVKFNISEKFYALGGVSATFFLGDLVNDDIEDSVITGKIGLGYTFFGRLGLEFSYDPIGVFTNDNTTGELFSDLLQASIVYKL